MTNGILIRAEIEDSGIRAKLMALIALGRNPAPALRDIATYGENSTRERFRTQIGPDGNRWKPSLRVQLSGGKTLTKDGHLADSISSRSGRSFAEWGTNRVYGAIHQLGGTIKPKGAGSLRFRLANGAFVSTDKVEIPARPYLGVNDENAADILDLLSDRIEGVR